MKKLLISAIMLLATLSTSAKVVSAARDTQRVNVGIRGSFTLSNLNQKAELMAANYLHLDQEAVTSTRLMPAFAAGFAMDIPVLESFHFNVELKYVMKGMKVETDLKSMPLDNDIEVLDHLGYLELPVQPQFRLNFSPKFHVNLNAGPYIAVALQGNEQNIQHYELNSKEFDYVTKTYVFTGQKAGKTDQFDDPENNYKITYHRFDVGMAFGLDFVVKKFHVGASFDLGMRDLYAVSLAGVEQEILDTFYSPVKTRTLYFTVGWDF